MGVCRALKGWPFHGVNVQAVTARHAARSYWLDLSKALTAFFCSRLRILRRLLHDAVKAPEGEDGVQTRVFACFPRILRSL